MAPRPAAASIPAEVRSRMKWFPAWAPVATALLVLVVSASATTTPTRKLNHATGPITALAMDGAQVAYSTDEGDVYVWNVRSGKTWHVRFGSGADDPPIGVLAVAGRRVAWIKHDVIGNSMETNEDLVTTVLGSYGKRTLAHAYRTFDEDLGQWRGDWIGGLVGSGAAFAVSRWTTTPDPAASQETISNARLGELGAGGRLRPVAAGADAVVSGGIDARGVAVLRRAGTVGFYSRAGALLWQTASPSAQEIALGGGHLVALTRAKTLEVRAARTGALERTWPIGAKPYTRPGHLQAYGRLALVVLGHSLRIVDLSTGKGLSLPRREGSAAIDAVVGPLGVVYAVNSYKAYGGRHPSGTLVFLSTARVLKEISRARR